jgi:hypothetical protein
VFSDCPSFPIRGSGAPVRPSLSWKARAGMPNPMARDSCWAELACDWSAPWPAGPADRYARRLKRPRPGLLLQLPNLGTAVTAWPVLLLCTVILLRTALPVILLCIVRTAWPVILLCTVLLLRTHYEVVGFHGNALTGKMLVVFVLVPFSLNSCQPLVWSLEQNRSEDEVPLKEEAALAAGGLMERSSWCG